MYLENVQSDQLYTWSDEKQQTNHVRLAKEARRSPAAVAPAPDDPPWLPHRALQTVRQAGMQMRRGPGPWPQVLSLGQLPRVASTNGLPPAGALRANGGVPRQLSQSPRDPGGDLRDQPRIAPPTRGALEVRHAQGSSRPPHSDRCQTGRRAPRQYARSLAGWPS